MDGTGPDADGEAVTATTGAPAAPDTMDRFLARVARAPALLARGAVIDDTFEVERVLGVGGMGVVYLARDLRLHREVAVKLHTAGSGFDRALREAKVMARLSHPDVVTVHEVGVHDGHLYIAMEYVEGGSLRGWLDAAPRRWREVLDAFVHAGRGLAAAHAAGLVHRDFKPDNVLRGADGRIRVADFGLARAADAAADAPEAGAVGPHLTEAGARAGTPRYMSPEQQRGDDLDARTDQYSFCVAAREALGGRGPRWLRRVLERGVEPDPARRWPSMNALLAEIARARRRRRAAAAATVAAVVVAGAAVIGWQARRVPARPDPCAGAAEAIASAWSPARRAALIAPLGADAPAVLARLDRYALSWTVEHRAACEATRVRGDQSERVLDHRMACLGVARAALAALVGLLETDADVRPGALAAIDTLPDTRDCADTSALAALTPYPLDPDRRARLDALADELARIDVLRRAGRIRAAADAAAGALEAAADARYPPLLAAALATVAELKIESGHTAEGMNKLIASLYIAIEAGDDRLVISAGLDAVEDLAVAGQLGQATGWMALVDAFVARTGTAATFDAERAYVRGQIALRERRYADAAELARAALAAVHGDRQDDAIAARILLAAALVQAGRFDDADAALAPVLGYRAQDVSPVALATGLSAIADLRYQRGDADGAEAAARQARALRVAAFGEASLPVADIDRTLALVALARGDVDAAIALDERVLVALGADEGIEVAGRAEVLGNLAIALAAAGRTGDALARARASLAAFEHVYVPDDPTLVKPTQVVGTLERYTGDLEGSERTLRAAVALATDVLPPDDLDRANAEAELGLTLLARGRPDDAAGHLERAVEVERGGAPRGNLAEARFALARARWALGDHARALELARAARPEWAAMPDAAAQLAELDAWLAARGPR